jgi:diguanylate cyclase (GGDEF)-like protein/PAS domain S-box-containing protein
MSNIVQSSPNFISYNKLDGKCVYVNPAATTHTGYSNDELMKDYIHVLYGENGNRKVSDMVETMQKSGLVKHEYESKLKDGSLRTFAGISFLIENDAFATIASDITEAKQIQEALIQRDKLLGAVNQASSLLINTSIDKFENDFHQSTLVIAEALNIDCVYLWKNFDFYGELYCFQVFEWTPLKTRYAEDPPCSYSDIVPGWEDILSAGKNINSLVRNMSPKEQAHLSPEGILSILVIPIFRENQFWGFVGFDDCKQERIFPAEIEAIMHSAGLMLAKAWLQNETTRDKEEADKLTKLMLDSSPLSCQLWNKNLKIFDCNEAALKLFNFKDKQEYIDRFFECSPEYQSDGQRSSEKAIKILKEAFKEGRQTFEWIHHLPGSNEQIPIEGTLVRVKYKDDFILAGYTKDLRDISTMERQISRLETEVEKIYYDALTGIYNRRFLDENLNRIIKSLSRSGSTLSLMMIDIDHFKEYNDTYGHSKGDICLEAVAKALTGCVTRGDDFVVRYGGEEFAVVLPNTDEIGARMIAEKLLSDIRGRNIPHIGSDTTDFVTISIGVTTGIPSMKKNGEDFIKCADKMLYESKRAGRNRYTYTELQ